MADIARTGTVNLCSERALKTCLGCKESKPLEAFHKCKTVKDGRKGRCAECLKGAHRKWRLENPEKAKASTESWRLRNLEKMTEYQREYDRRYRIENLEKLRASREARRESLAANLAAWKAANREKVRDYERRRRAAVRGSKIEELDLELAWAESGEVCAICNTGMDREIPWPQAGFPSLDHIIPLAKGGGHVQSNVRYVHLVCNMRKNDRLDHEMTSTVLP